MIDRLLRGAASVSESVISAAPGRPPELAQARVIDETSNRPWPVPETPWLMAQTWRDLLFAHWPLPPEAVREALPVSLPLDTYDGQAWIGITPFELRGLRLRGLPPIPGISGFPELNLRIYTTLDGKPGIYFLSLDAANPVAVLAARRAFRLPYFRAQMAIQRRAGGVEYVSRRSSPNASPAGFAATYRPTGAVFHATPGSLEYFLTERYCLYTTDQRGSVLRAEIQHPPWPLRVASAEIGENSMTRPWGIELPRVEPLLHFASLQNVLIWPLRPAQAK